MAKAAEATSKSEVVEGCPAFAEGCPFSKEELLALPALQQLLAQGAFPQSMFAKCDGFKDGCPFKVCESVESLYNKLSEMPSTHRFGMETPAAKSVVEVFKMVHEQSKIQKAKVGAQCPVFATSCPFKTLTSDGLPLVEELDSVVTAWGLTEDYDSISPQAADTPLSKSLKAGTKDVHRAAENVRFVRDFLRGTVPRESYIELLKSLYYVYDALERAIRQLPLKLQHCDFAVLYRTAALEADLRYYLGLPEDQPFDVGPPSVAAKSYVDHLDNLVATRPLMVLAHAYTRYLGDLSGGQILARAATKAYHLEKDQGISFYEFDRIGVSPQDIKAFKKDYRAQLDDLRLTQKDADGLVDEARASFLMNMLLFEERDVAAGHLARVRSLDEVLELVKSNKSALGFQRAYGQGQDAPKSSGKCPFLDMSRDADGAAPADKLARCPWPFIWMHDPRNALALHPVKNIGSVFALAGLAKAAWHYPRSAGAGLFGVGLLSMHLRKRHKRHPTR